MRISPSDALVLALAFGWLMGCALTAAVASAEGRHGFWWGLGAFFLFSPLLALIALAALPAKPRETNDEVSQEESEPLMRRRRLP
jgi:hypothetical protein